MVKIERVPGDNGFTPSQRPDGALFYRNIPGLIEEEWGWFLNGPDNFYIEALGALPIQRGMGLKKLGFLANVGQTVQRLYGMEHFTHQVEEHLFLVARPLELVLIRLGFSDHEVMKAKGAGLVHDIAIPAGGEAVVGLDALNLGEEENWYKVIEPAGWDFLVRYGLDFDDLDPVVRNKGAIGQILDIIDRIAYTARDSLSIPNNDRPEVPPLLYKDLRITDDGEPFFTDPDRLFDFLLARALNHYHVYLHPINRGADLMIRKLLKPLYSPDGGRPLSPERLRHMTDYGLCSILQNYYRLPFTDPRWVQGFLVNLYPRVQSCYSPGHADAIFRAYASFSDHIVLGIEKLPGFDTGVGYKVWNRATGGIVPFEEYAPEDAEFLESINRGTRGTYVYYYDVSGNNSTNDIVRRLFTNAYEPSTEYTRIWD